MFQSVLSVHPGQSVSRRRRKNDGCFSVMENSVMHVNETLRDGQIDLFSLTPMAAWILRRIFDLFPPIASPNFLILLTNSIIEHQTSIKNEHEAGESDICSNLCSLRANNESK